MDVKVMVHGKGQLPQYKTSGSSGFDLCSTEKHVIQPFGCALIGTGLRVQIPDGYELQIRSRSGLAARDRIFVLNSPGTIDSDYRGEIKVILFNLHKFGWFYVNPGDRIAQGVLCPIVKANFVLEELNETERGEGGFGSTGM